ncbi:hypothetical protein [Ulvibacter litoralis]|uniref:Uncharacterized protein n=1 Tax=Ulvibacter litoralis TaxID=227084 RepID=A0A1G7HHK9_9FLAO|nr:hypothetical protein [Ulvibacter litoralis]GHC57864.1 hypothetical protein GCM10008083_23120 [Ulvibacter litoralis]SDE99997.1 hypothetical protein SAMN05421855_104102 [Ulvibacter litoralis]
MKKLRRRKKNRTDTSKSDAPFFPAVQEKLALGKADDAYEKEADAMADTVVGTAENTNVQKMENEEESVQQKSLSDTITTIQKEEMAAEEETVQKQQDEEEEPLPQTETEEKAVQKMEEDETS